MVFLYVRGADNRAQAAEAPVQVLKATAMINAGESVTAAQAAEDRSEHGAEVTGADRRGEHRQRDGQRRRPDHHLPGRADHHQQVRRAGRREGAHHPRRGHRDFGEPVRHRTSRRFISPGSNVAMFLTGPAAGETGNASSTAASSTSGTDGTKLLLPKVEVIAVGNTTTISTTSTDPTGASTTETLAEDAVHSRGGPGPGTEDHLRQQPR